MERSVTVAVDDDLRPLLPARDRAAGRRVLAADPDATVGHLVQAAGVPLTEVGELLVGGVPVSREDRPPAGARVVVRPVRRPQPVPAGGFLLDVGLGALARRMRLLGLDAAWSPEARAPDADDAELVAAAVAGDRVLLTQDRGLLMRRALPAGAWVRGATPDDQLADVLDRFRPPLAPRTRCPACNGVPAPVPAAEVAALVEPGTRRTATEFTRCPDCRRVYWRGAHARRIDELVERARRLTDSHQRYKGELLARGGHGSAPVCQPGRAGRGGPPGPTEGTPCPSTCSPTCPTTTGHWSRTSPARSCSCTTTSTTRPT